MPQTPGSEFPALRNALDLLRAFDASHPTLGVTELAQLTGLHKSTVSRLLQALDTEGLVERDPRSRQYSLGLGLVQLAGPLLGTLDVRRTTRPALEQLRDATGESAVLAQWTGTESVVVEQASSHHEIAHNTPIGARYGQAMSASVQVFLGHMPWSRVEHLIMSGTVLLPSVSDSTLAEFRALLEEGTSRGVFVNAGRTSSDVIGISAPVMDHRGDLVGAVLLAAPAYRVGQAALPLLVQATQEAAHRASTAIGHRTSAETD